VGSPPPPPSRLALRHRLVHCQLEVVAQVVPELPAHLLHEAGHARRIVLVEIPEARGLGERTRAGRPGIPRWQGGTGAGTGTSRRRRDRREWPPPTAAARGG